MGEEKKAAEMTSYILHKHYCENDVDALIETFAEPFHWLGAAEQEYALGAETVAGIFRQFAGRVPRCDISDEQYDVSEIAPGVYLCTGRYWVSTDPSTETYLKVHQRITAIFRREGEKLKCIHIHISNPYVEMEEDDVGFPTKMAEQSRKYMMECLRNQREKIEKQTEELVSIYNTVPCYIMRFSRRDGVYRLLTFNRALAEMLGHTEEEIRATDWSRGYALDVVKEDQRRLEEALENLKTPGQVTRAEYRLRNSEGKLLNLSCVNSYVGRDGESEIIQRIAFDISERVEMENLLKEMSYRDALTGMYNRSRMNRDIAMRFHADDGSLGVVCMDINGLKAVNDREGHLAGDDLIVRTARAIDREFGRGAYRIGGDEFLVIAEREGKERLRERLESLRNALASEGIHISIGLSWREKRAEDIYDQIRDADRDMYEDKRKFYTSGEHDRRRR